MFPQASRHLLAFAILPALIFPFLGCALYFGPLLGTPLGKVVYGSVKVFTLTWPLVAAYFLLGGLGLRQRFGTWNRHLRSLPLGLVSGLAISAFGVLAFAFTPLGDAVQDSEPKLRNAISEFGTLQHYWIAAVLISVFHSLIEEIYWRWFAFGGLRRLIPLPAAVIIAALAFMAHHVLVLLQFFPAPLAWLLSAMVAVGGVLWNVMYHRQKTLAGVWLSHAIVDFAIMILGWYILQNGGGELP